MACWPIRSRFISAAGAKCWPVSAWTSNGSGSPRTASGSRNTIRCGLSSRWRRLLSTWKCSWEQYPRKKELFRTLIAKGVPLAPGVKELLGELHGRYRLAVVSSSSRLEVEPALEVGGIRQFFDALVCGSDAARLKPAPDPYLKGAELLESKHPLVVEDSAAGVASAQAAGFDFVRIASVEEMAASVRAHLGSRRVAYVLHLTICSRSVFKLLVIRSVSVLNKAKADPPDCSICVWASRRSGNSPATFPARSVAARKPSVRSTSSKYRSAASGMDREGLATSSASSDMAACTNRCELASIDITRSNCSVEAPGSAR